MKRLLTYAKLRAASGSAASFVMKADRRSASLSFVPNRLTAPGLIHAALATRHKVHNSKREPFSPGWYRRYRWYSKGKSSGEAVLTRVQGGTGKLVSLSRYQLVPPAVSPDLICFRSAVPPVPPVPPPEWADPK